MDKSQFEGPRASKKTALLVMVHGSPKASANAPMFDVVDLVRKKGVYQIVEVGFMECNEPTIPDAIARCVAQGAERVIATPYFLHVGTHVADDLPTLIEQAQASYPDVEFLMGRYLGQSPLLTQILSERAHDVQSKQTIDEQI